MKTTFKKGDRVRLTKDARRNLRGAQTWWPQEVGRVVDPPPTKPHYHVYIRFPKGGSGFMRQGLLEKVR